MSPGWENGRRWHCNVARAKLREFDIRKRWAKYPQLGPLPAAFQRHGDPPATVGDSINLALDAFYLPGVRQMLNSSTILLKRLR